MKKSTFRIIACILLFACACLAVFSGGRLIIAYNINHTTPLQISPFSRLHVFENSESRILLEVLKCSDSELNQVIELHGLRNLEKEQESTEFYLTYLQFRNWSFTNPRFVWVGSGFANGTRWETAVDLQNQIQVIAITYDY